MLVFPSTMLVFWLLIEAIRGCIWWQSDIFNPQNLIGKLPIVYDGVNILDVVDQSAIFKILNAGLEDMFSFCQLLARLEFLPMQHQFLLDKRIVALPFYHDQSLKHLFLWL